MASAARVLTGPDRIRRSAVALFRERGYHGTPMRALAQTVRMEAGSLYYHVPSKQQLLFEILDRTLDDLLAGLEEATAGAAGPVARLRAAVRFHVLFHALRREEAFLSHSELRSLTSRNLRRVIAKRDRYERAVRDVLAAGARTGVFAVADPRLAAMAILTMCTGVATWFSESGRLKPEAIADHYADMVLALVGADRPVRRARMRLNGQLKGPRA
jgi:AcrR family transcriptional regulator